MRSLHRATGITNENVRGVSFGTDTHSFFIPLPRVAIVCGRNVAAATVSLRRDLTDVSFLIGGERVIEVREEWCGNHHFQLGPASLSRASRIPLPAVPPLLSAGDDPPARGTHPLPRTGAPLSFVAPTRTRCALRLGRRPPAKSSYEFSGRAGLGTLHRRNALTCMNADQCMAV